jgi:hypothetical protein
MSIDLSDREFRGRERVNEVQIFEAAGLPLMHPAEADVFARQLDIPGHRLYVVRPNETVPGFF